MKVEFKYEFKDIRDRVTTEVTVVSHEDGLGELVQEFRHFLLAIGFAPESVANYIEED